MTNRMLAVFLSFFCLAIQIAEAAEKMEEPAEIPCRWERLNLNGGGFIGRVVVSPHNPERVYCVSDKGGIHRSDDGGKSWEMCNRGFRRETCYGVSDLVIDPRNPERLYAAVGNGSWSWKHWYPGAVFRSDDGGRNWVQQARLGFAGECVPGKGYGNRLCFSSDNSDILYAATFSQGVFRTSDGGMNWRKLGLDDKFLTGIMVDPENPDIILASAQLLPLDPGRTGGIFESRDGGKSWRQMLNENVISISRAPFNMDWLVAVCDRQGIRFSRDRGRSWEAIPLHPRQKAVKVAKFQPGYESRLWATSGGEGAMFFYTDDFGKSWVQPAADFRSVLRYPGDWYLADRKWAPFTSVSGVRDVAFDSGNPGRIFLSDFHTVWRSDDGGKHFQAYPHGLNTLCVYQIVIDPRDSKTIYVNNADMGLLKSSDGGGNFRWPFVREGEIGDRLINETSQLLISASDPRKLAVSVTVDWADPLIGGVYTSSDGGKNWTAASGGLPQRGRWMTGLAALSDDLREMVVACGGSGTLPGNVYYTKDGGGSWEPFGSGLPEAPLFGNSWKTLPNLATDGRYVYAATAGGVFRCSRIDRVWKRIGVKELEKKTLRTLAAVPGIPGRVWIGTGSGLLVSSDSGETFRTASLPGMQMCQGIAVDPRDPDRWFVAVSAPWWTGHANQPGIYLTEDSGKSYRRLSDMPGEGMAWRLTLDPGNPDLLYVGTNGIGAWRTEVGRRRL